MIEKDYGELIALLTAARKETKQIRAVSPDLIPPTASDGYRVNARVSERLGYAPLGWKIAATTPEMQRRLRATEPIYGRTFAPFAHHSPARLLHRSLLDPIVECEFFFRLAHDLPPRRQPYSAEEVADAVALVHAGVEIAECRFPLDALPPMAAILADGAASGRYVIGPAIADWRQHDLAAMGVTLTVNGALRRSGAGHEVMGHPLDALAWLANARRHWGDGLKADELVSTGTATGMLLAKQGDHMRAEFGGRWNVEIFFE